MHSSPWSHRLRALTNNEIPGEELEALSRRYSSATILLLPLSSGRVALFDNARVFRLLAEESDLTHSILSKLSSEWETELRAEMHHAERLRELRVVEPDARSMARDIRRAEHATSTRVSTYDLPALDLDSI